MSAEIVDFVKVRAERVRQSQARASVAVYDQSQYGLPAFVPGSVPPLSVATGASAEGAPSFQFWTGASGARYVHSVYHLFECPPFDQANYVLVKRHDGGQRTVLAIGRASHTASSLNLAEVRQRAAQLGANEVHLHLLASGQDDSCRIEADLRGSLVLA